MSETPTVYTPGNEHAASMKYRSKGIGGSDVASVLGISKWKSPVQLWMEKTGRAESAPDNNTFRRGRALEPIVLDEYTAQTGLALKHVEPIIAGCFIASIDAMTADGLRVVDAKTTTRMFDGIPLYYETQLQWYMGFFPTVQFGDLPTWDLLTDEINCDLSCVRNDELIAQLRAIVLEFWRRYVEGNTPPPPQSEDDCKLIWTRHNPGKIVVATDVEISALAQLKAAKEKAKAAKSEEEAAKFIIMRHIADADTMTDAAGVKLCTFKNNKDGTKTDWEGVARSFNPTAELIAKHTTTTPGARVLRLSK